MQVELDFWPVTWQVRPTPTISGGGDWSASVDPAEYEKGVGLYHVRAITDVGCLSEGWIMVEGSPFSTWAGRAASATLIVGVLWQLLALWRGSWWSAVAGLPTGVGLAVLLQQFGVAPLNALSVAVCTGSSMAAGAVANLVLRARGAPRSAERGGGDFRTRAMPRSQPGPLGRGHEPAIARTSNGEPIAAATNGEPMAAPPNGEPMAAAPAVTPPRSFPLLECAATVLVGSEFDLNIGLSPEPVPGVVSEGIVRPEEFAAGYPLSVHVVADGFALRAGEKWRREVEVTPGAPYPSFTVHLTADTQEDDALERTIQAFYSIKGQSVGFASRAIRVVRHAGLAGQPAVAAQDTGALMSLPVGKAPDLTIHITNGKSESDGRFRMILMTPHDVPMPDELEPIDLGDKAADFAKKIAVESARKDGAPDLYLTMVGLGRRVSDQLPVEFWDVLSAIYERIGKRPPTILISTEEPYVPWELAVVEPPLDDGAPPFLGAQAAVGRWVPGKGSRTKPARPALVPPPEVHVSAMAVVSGVYERARLIHAEREAAAITAKYKGLAVPVNAITMDVLRCIGQGDPRAELIHFAMHGKYDPEGVRDGLVLIDDETLDPNAVMGATLQWAPFVFLNACQIGSGQKVLGDYAGMAHAFLRAGASGVIAPLWSVRDDIAREIALRFYEEAFKGSSPAEVLRMERVRFKNSPDTVTATFLAYQYFGDPAMRIIR